MCREPYPRPRSQPRGGITPTRVGSSADTPCRRTCRADHPRVRGEQASTSTGGVARRDHPRVRGEQASVLAQRVEGVGSPRVRGEHDIGFTPGGGVRGSPPRAPGEQCGPTRPDALVNGSPPRARGAGGHQDLPRHGVRITPACAGSRVPCGATSSRRWDRPRVRGKQPRRDSNPQPGRGSPPRARGAVLQGVPDVAGQRITPACAGSRSTRRPSCTASRDHPCVRGEQRSEWKLFHQSCGSPPRAPGAGTRREEGPVDAGITPACAGSSDEVTPVSSLP